MRIDFLFVINEQEFSSNCTNAIETEAPVYTFSCMFSILWIIFALSSKPPFLWVQILIDSIKWNYICDEICDEIVSNMLRWEEREANREWNNLYLWKTNKENVWASSCVFRIERGQVIRKTSCASLTPTSVQLGCLQSLFTIFCLCNDQDSRAQSKCFVYKLYFSLAQVFSLIFVIIRLILFCLLGISMWKNTGLENISQKEKRETREKKKIVVEMTVKRANWQCHKYRTIIVKSFTVKWLLLKMSFNWTRDW